MPTVGTVTSYVTPIGFYNYAADFAKWAERSHAEGSQFFSPVPFFLYCRSIELLLKAFLLARGLPKAELKKRQLGHNLANLLVKARQFGLHEFTEVTANEESLLMLINPAYSGKELEYFNVGFGYLSDSALPHLQSLSARLRETVRPLCLHAADLPGPPPLPPARGAA